MRRLTMYARAVGCAAMTLALVGFPVGSIDRGRPVRHQSLTPSFERVAAGIWRTAPTDAEGFSLAGLSWPHADRAQGRPAIRTSVDAVRWSPWTVLHAADNGPDRGSNEDRGVVATEPMWVGRSRFAQVRWTDGTPPRGVRLHVIDPGTTPAQPRASAMAAPDQPQIFSRARWGADESIRRCCPTFARSVDFAVVHHTVGSNSYTREESASVVRGVYEYHVRANGWDDIGYHFLVDRYGQVFEGRSGGIREAVIGAHAEGFNTGSTGVALMGSFQSASPTTEMTTALTNLLAWKLDVHHVDPRGSVNVVSAGSRKHPAGRQVRVNTISGHRDLQETACPGDPVYASLGRLRSDVHGRGFPKIFDPKVSPLVFTPNGDGTNDTLRATATLSDGAAWRVRARSSDGEVQRSWEGVGAVDVRWDGRNQINETLPHGYYTIDISATAGAAQATPAEVIAGLYRDPWTGWSRAGTPSDRPGRPRVAAGSNGTFHLLTRAADGTMRTWRWTPNTWGPGTQLGPPSIAAPSGRFGFVSAGGVLHAAVRDRNGNLLHGRILSNGTFEGWTRIGRAADRGTDISLAAGEAGTLHAMTVGMGGNLFASTYRSGSWSSWRRVGSSNDKGTQPVLATGQAGDVLAVVVGGSNVIYANKLDPGRGWRSRWSSVSRNGRGSEPDVTAVEEGFLVVVRGQSTPTVWATAGTISGWTAWSRVGRASDSGYEPTAVTVSQDILLVVRGRTSRRLYANVRGPDGAWRGWDEAGDSIQNGQTPSLAASGDVAMVAAEVPDGQPATALARPPLRPR